jgi:general secretion pathway protein L
VKQVIENIENIPTRFAENLVLTAADSGQTAPIILPAEQVTLLTASLPVRGARAKRAALPFALEERISAPLGDVHIALCRSLDSDNKILAAVVDRKVMEALDGRVTGPVWPETFALPSPAAPEGTVVWAVWRDADRALVRVSDGTGFIVDQAMLPLIWDLAQKPEIFAYGDALPALLDVQSHSSTPPKPDPKDLAVDLRQGQFAQASTNWSYQLKRVVALGAIALIGHFGIAAADAVALRNIADRERVVAQAAIDTILPGMTLAGDITPIIRRLAPTAQPQTGSAFLPLLARVSSSLSEVKDQVSFRRMTFSDTPARLTFLIETPTLDALQQAERLLRAQGLDVRSGAATATAGVAEAEFIVSSEASQ